MQMVLVIFALAVAASFAFTEYLKLSGQQRWQTVTLTILPFFSIFGLIQAFHLKSQNGTWIFAVSAALGFALYKLPLRKNIRLATALIGVIVASIGSAALAARVPVLEAEQLAADQQARAEIARAEAMKAEQAEVRYHRLIDASIFEALPMTELTDFTLRDRWKDLNLSRIAAAKLALDHQNCGAVEAAGFMRSPMDAVDIKCRSGKEFVFTQDAISNSQGGELLGPEIRPHTYWGDIRQGYYTNCLLTGAPNC